MKNNKGFTLVELLAVIVILAIIMVISIPAVLDTMVNARKKSFNEYATKVSTGAEKQYLEDQLTSNPGTCVLYDIKKDLGFSSTGNYEGYVIVKMTNDNPKIYITLKDKDYMIYGVDGTKLDTVELKNYSDGEYLSDINLLSVAKCEVYSVVKEESNSIEKYEKKTATLIENPESSTPIVKKLLTGEKAGKNNWIGVYENGTIVGCYSKYGTYEYDPYSTNEDGSLETSYCTGHVTAYDEKTCLAAKSTECCTASEQSITNPYDAFMHFSVKTNGSYVGYPERGCGYMVTKSNNGQAAVFYGGGKGGELPESGVYED